MTSGFQKFRLLLWKNYVLQKRKPVVTFFEIFLPAIFAVILVLVRMRVESFNIDHPTTWDSFKVNSLDPVTFSFFKSSPPKVAYTPVNNITTEIVTRAYQYLGQSESSIEGFASEEALVEHVMFNNITTDLTSQFMAGIVFTSPFTNEKTVPFNISYTLRFSFSPRTASPIKVNGFVTEKWKTESEFSIFQKIGPREANSSDGGKPGYYQQGFLPLQHAIDVAIVQLLNSSFVPEDKIKLSLRRFPYPPYLQDNFVLIIQQQLPLILMMSFVFAALQIVKDIVHEKERRLKESMKMMGMGNWLHWAAWFVKYFLFLLIDVAIMTVLFCIKVGENSTAVVGKSDPSVILVFLVVYSISSIAFCFLVSVLFKKANSAAAAGGILFFLTYVPYSFIQPRYGTMNLTEKVASCLIFNVGMSFGGQLIGMFEGAGAGVQWYNIAQGVSVDDNFTMLHILVVLLVDSVLYMLLAFYIEAVFPGEFGLPQPWYFPVTRSFWCGTKQKKVYVMEDEECAPLMKHATGAQNHSEYFEKDPSGLHAGIRIMNLRKEFHKKVAVAGTSLNMYEGQITALLGHNGAGKTTTMSMLTGFLPPTSGTAVLNGYDILEDIGSVRSSLGLCPQHDVLFDTLTVEEHLEFFAKLKGFPVSQMNEEITRILDTLGLSPKRHAQSKTLSGGMKRKLSVGIALIGGSKVLILDEPTSGMDPDARRHTWEILQQQREGRTILLTTHFMDEADVLGDRIAIMADGVVQCCGSSLFLKNKYGAGYHMVIVKEPNCVVSKITDIIKKYVPGAAIESNVSAELSYILPHDSCDQFEGLFSDLELMREDLGIASFGASVTTMEEVFLKVGEFSHNGRDSSGEYESTSYSVPMNSAVNGHIPSIEPEDSAFVEDTKCNRGFALYTQQFYAMFVKHILHTWRNVVLTTSQLLVPLFFTILVLIILKTLPTPDDSPPLAMVLDNFRQPVVPYSPGYQPSAFASHFGHVFEMQYKGTNVEAVNINEKEGNITMINYLVEKATNDLAEFDNRYLVASEFHEVSGAYLNATALFNNQGYHTPAITLSAFDNAVLKYYANSSYNIRTTNHPLPPTSNDKVNNQLLSLAWAFSIAFNVLFGMSFLASSFVLFIIKERAIKSKHVQFVSGVHAINFWVSTFVWDVINFLIPSVLIIITFAAFDIPAFINDGRFMLTLFLFFLYAWAMLPQMYVLSFIFTVPSSGLVWLTMLNFLSGIATMLAVDILSIPELDLVDLSKVLNWIFLVIFPNFCLGTGLQTMYALYASNALYDDVCRKNAEIFDFVCHIKQYETTMCCPKCTVNCLSYESNYLVWDEIGIGREVLFLALQGLLFFSLLFLMESEYLKKLWYRMREKQVVSRNRTFSGISMDGRIQEDTDVKAERERILKQPPMYHSDALVLRELTKYYGSHLAVNNVTVGIPQGECFGLLGVNGAGKTTTFKMLTGDEIVSSGNAYLQNVDIRSNIKTVQQRLGYCPQFDALLDQMTGRETLFMFARLRGVVEAQIPSVVQNLMSTLLLEEHADKLVKDYSGGNKRKLSTAVALVGNPPVIFLDEPSSGMDPVARRHLWNTLAKVRASGRTLVLTSHSMEECEALCTRIAIMVNGQYKCLGSTQHLKNKFGEGYTLIARIGPPSRGEDTVLQPVMEFIEKSFPGSVLKDEHQGLVHYHITDTTLSWAKIFGTMERAKAEFHIEDYSVSQTTLEQVFINFARSQVAPEEVEMGTCATCGLCCKMIFGCYLCRCENVQ
ncbi:ATP-binding cassette sub-family A member 3 isoform X2 [Lingula anatina]|uniref:ATP-binding cassette sub-family A member 3 isoform X2 n=1 Tax=Lingula anatina TaxID=7574 RepID=A0A1S3JLC6_LINAN|nr:ATP-binding cassette sub-family A member 3 isoform X2 [Lingula anatina]|eukprot:XP_013411172.1 ATP-binding cassette sub-family A member 3 isoform X2 [Lingula anatina]